MILQLVLIKKYYWVLDLAISFRIKNHISKQLSVPKNKLEQSVSEVFTNLHDS